MSKEMKEMLSRLLGDDVDVIPDFDILEDKETRDFIFSVIQTKQLKRIADVLEDMNAAVIEMSADINTLSECVGYAPPKYKGEEGYKYLRV